MTDWKIKPKTGDGWMMNDSEVTMNSSNYSMNYYFADTVWQILSAISSIYLFINLS